MTSVTIRQSDNENIIHLSQDIIEKLCLQVDSKLDLSIENNRVVLTPIKEEISLEDVLSGSPKECFKITGEDREWIDTIL